MAIKKLLIPLLLGALTPAFGQWHDFRGPTGDGIVPPAADGKPLGLPVEWSEDKNIVWKTAIEGRAWSTPAISGNRIWVTNATKDGQKMFAVCLDRETGAIVHDLLLFENSAPEPLGNDVNGYGSPSPAISGNKVFVHFGSYGTAALDVESGKILWQRRDLPCRHFRGPGSSPAVYKNLLILSMDGIDVQYLAALDVESGKTVWKTDRSTVWDDVEPDGKIRGEGDSRKAYTTPYFIEIGGKTQMISSGAKSAFSYEPETGKEIWKITYDGFSNAARPFTDGEMLFLNTGFGKAHLLGVRIDPKATGDITDTHVAWDSFKRVPTRSSALLAKGNIFFVNDEGILSCLDPKTGETLWDHRIPGHFSGSPIFADGHLYFASEQGNTYVLEPDAMEFKQVAANQLDEGCMASPAVDGKSLYLRTKTHLYRIEAKE
jgi:outer membrane protein assembly factor BamB